MLYDILIIDDDFSGETVLDDLLLSSDRSKGSSGTSWSNTIMPFYFDLTRQNLRVIWSTGELDNLEELEKYQLLKIKHIICDLHLSGITDTTDSKNIIAKILGIINKLNDNFEEEYIYFWINSKYIDKHRDIKDYLQDEFRDKYTSRYAVTEFSGKNVISDEQKKELLDISLLSHIKEQVIKKHLELERCLIKKLIYRKMKKK